jgi:ATP-dependent exoDNAse (exonuclease V) alpha subunit
MPQHLRALLSSSARLGKYRRFNRRYFSNRLRKPATGSFDAEMDGVSAPSIFSFMKEKKKKDERGKRTMAIYHLEAKVVSRGAGRSAVAASAYLSCSRLYNDYDGIQHDYTKKQGLVWQEVFLPEYAPQEWKDREQLWNAVEEVETAKDSRLAREFVVALPIELSREEQIELLQEFIREQFVSDGMCADAAIHDTDGHNPHAHILLTVRPLDERGKWQYKTEKEYLCMRNGEERGFTAAEFKVAQNEGWEKQYPYKVGKKKVYMTPSDAEAQIFVRADKHPKSTRYGRQNPISERWNSEEQLAAWRAAWADVSNRCLERAGREERIDHRSNAARGLDEIPTIHEGVAAQALERKGIISDRCEINRQIKADNALLRELKAEIKKLAAMIARTVPAIAEGLEKLRSRVMIFCYQLSHIRSGKAHIQKSLAVWKPELERYTGLVQQIKEKSKERKALVAEKKELPIYHVKHHKALALRIAELTEELEELRSGKALLLQKFEYAEDAGAETFRKDIATMEAGLKKLEAQEQKYSAELDKALDEYAELKAQAADFDPVELYKARQGIRPAQEKESEKQLEDAMHEKPSLIMLLGAKQETSRLLGDDADERQVRQILIRRQRSDPQKSKHFQR